MADPAGRIGRIAWISGPVQLQNSGAEAAEAAEKELAELVDKLMAGVRVFQAGGQEATDGNDLADRINRAAKSSAIRLYSQFDAADHEQWGKVLDEGNEGRRALVDQVRRRERRGGEGVRVGVIRRRCGRGARSDRFGPSRELGAPRPAPNPRKGSPSRLVGVR